MKNPLAKTQTMKNLEAAFAGESMANRKYLYFAKENDGAAVKEFQEQGEESKDHDERFVAMLTQAQRRFEGLTQVEKKHADAYQAKLDEKKANS